MGVGAWGGGTGGLFTASHHKHCRQRPGINFRIIFYSIGLNPVPRQLL